MRVQGGGGRRRRRKPRGPELKTGMMKKKKNSSRPEVHGGVGGGFVDECEQSRRLVEA